MKRILPFVFAAIMMAISCTKENNDEPYNPDGSPITQAQALEIVKEEIDEYDMVYVTSAIARKTWYLIFLWMAHVLLKFLVIHG